MGGSSGSSNTKPKKEEPSGTIPGTGPMMTQPAFIGDNQNLLAQQLAAGGYGNVPDLMTMLSNTFTPMQILDTRPGAVATPSTPTTPTTPTTGGGNKTPRVKGQRPVKGSGGGGTGIPRSASLNMLSPQIQSIMR
jgi:hypothetical protein